MLFMFHSNMAVSVAVWTQYTNVTDRHLMTAKATLMHKCAKKCRMTVSSRLKQCQKMKTFTNNVCGTVC